MILSFHAPAIPGDRRRGLCRQPYRGPAGGARRRRDGARQPDPRPPRLDPRGRRLRAGGPGRRGRCERCALRWTVGRRAAFRRALPGWGEHARAVSLSPRECGQRHPPGGGLRRAWDQALRAVLHGRGIWLRRRQRSDHRGCRDQPGIPLRHQQAHDRAGAVLGGPHRGHAQRLPALLQRRRLRSQWAAGRGSRPRDASDSAHDRCRARPRRSAEGVRARLSHAGRHLHSRLRACDGPGGRASAGDGPAGSGQRDLQSRQRERAFRAGGDRGGAARQRQEGALQLRRPPRRRSGCTGGIQRAGDARDRLGAALCRTRRDRATGRSCPPPWRRCCCSGRRF